MSFGRDFMPSVLCMCVLYVLYVLHVLYASCIYLNLFLPHTPTHTRTHTCSSTVVPLSAAALPQLKMLSFGHVNSNAGVVGAGAGSAAVVRGPVASRGKY